MRLSPLRHPLAVLRTIISKSQKEIAALVDRSTRTVQAIELGKLSLSEELARLLSHETGVSMQWLLNGDVSAPPYTELSAVTGNESQWVAFTKETYEHRQAHKELVQSSEDIGLPGHQVARLIAVIIAAHRSNQNRLANYRIEKFLTGLETEFGDDQENRLKIISAACRSHKTPDHSLMFEEAFAAGGLSLRDEKGRAIRLINDSFGFERIAMPSSATGAD